MDDDKGNAGHSIYASNEYPDLDLAPSYLWVGQDNDDQHHNIHVPSNGSPGRLAKLMRANDSSDGREHLGASNATGSEDMEENSWRLSADDVDPDFELEKDFSTQVFFPSSGACC
jgi:hypothetical protein